MGKIAWSSAGDFPYAKENHTHNYAGSSSAGGVANASSHFAMYDTIGPNDDWNDFTSPAVYCVSSATMTEECHAPVGVYNYGFLIVYTNSQTGQLGGVIHQTYLAHTGLIFVRQGTE